MKQLVKRTIYRVAPHVSPAALSIRARPSLLVLMYHRVLPPEHPARQSEQPGMYVSPDTFADHLDILRRHFTLVHLDDWLSAMTAGASLPPRACAITFDDGWRDNYEYAYPVLRRAAVPATIYLVSDLVGTTYTFWPNVLAKTLSVLDERSLECLPAWMRGYITDIARRGTIEGLDANQVDAIIYRCKQTRSDAEMLAVIAGLSSEPERSERDLLSWEEIREMHDTGLVRFGSHTRRHTRLSAVSSAQVLKDEILGSRDHIEQHLGVRPRTFCYPNGDTSPKALEIVREAYEGAVTTCRGWNRRNANPHLMRRIGVHEDIGARGAFLARINGWI